MEYGTHQMHRGNARNKSQKQGIAVAAISEGEHTHSIASRERGIHVTLESSRAFRERGRPGKRQRWQMGCYWRRLDRWRIREEFLLRRWNECGAE